MTLENAIDFIAKYDLQRYTSRKVISKIKEVPLLSDEDRKGMDWMLIDKLGKKV
jgi:hypothetical protein